MDGGRQRTAPRRRGGEGGKRGCAGIRLIKLSADTPTDKRTALTMAHCLEAQDVHLSFGCINQFVRLRSARSYRPKIQEEEIHTFRSLVFQTYRLRLNYLEP